MKLEQLIASFADNAGITDATPVEGVWKFSADGNVFGLTTDDMEDRVWIFGEIASPDPDRKDAFLKSAMEANYFHRGTGGATFSINPDNGELTLFAAERLDGLGEEEFFSFVEKFVNVLATWNGLARSAGGQTDFADEERPVSSGPTFFMPV